MTNTEKINAIKQLLKKYNFQFKEATISDIMEEMSHISLYEIAELIADVLGFGSKLTDIINEETK